MVCTLGRQIRIAGALIGEAIVVHDVPVENVHFVVRHGVQREQYVVNGKVMARRVQQESTMRKPREIYDTLASYLQVRSIPGRDQELRKGFQPSKNPPYSFRVQIHRRCFVYVQLV